MPDLIVIGSGLGGLCAAAIASRHGLEVQVPVGYTPANEPWELWRDPERGTPIKGLVL